MKIQYTVPLVAMTKKNHHRIITIVDRETGKRKPALVPSEQYKKFESDCGWFLKPVPSIPIDTPINIKYSFYMDVYRTVDVANLINGMDDILVSYGIIKDDNCKILVSHDGTRVYYDKNNPHIEIEITDTEPTFIKPEKPKKKKV